MDLCFECDRPADHNHHVVPQSQGGTRTIPLCEECHEKVHGLKAGIYALARAARAAHQERKAAGLVAQAARAKAARDKEDARKLAMIRELRIQRMSLRAVADRLNEMGETTSSGKKWTHAVVDAVLRRTDAYKAYRKKTAEIKAEHAEFRSKVCPIIQGMRDQGMTYREITAQLNALGVKAIQGGKWTHSQIPNYLRPKKPTGRPTRQTLSSRST